MAATQVLENGIVTLSDEGVRAVAGNAQLWNDDLRPCTRQEHTWGSSRYSSLWIGMCLCIPTYSLASGMISLGMNWWQSVLTVFTGSVVVLIPILLVAHAGTRYGIPYPVFARLWFGTRGAHLPALARAVIAAGWFGINSWFGGLGARCDPGPACAGVARYRHPHLDSVRRLLAPQRRDRDAWAAGDRSACGTCRPDPRGLLRSRSSSGAPARCMVSATC